MKATVKMKMMYQLRLWKLCFKEAFSKKKMGKLRSIAL